MKEYRMEIWVEGCVVDIYDSEDIGSVVEWFNQYWRECYTNGGCAFDIFRKHKKLSLSELYKLGFED